MGNNETSGPVLTTYLARWLAGLKNRYYTYRLVFVPETIGSIVYLSRNLEALKRNVVAGFQVTCVGDDRAYSFLSSRLGKTLADKVALHILKHHAPTFTRYSFLDRGSDERQYCSPGVDLPVVSIMRSKYATYPEYHTSLDDLSFISPQGLAGAWHLYARCINLLEHNRKYRTTCLCEPQMGRRGLYPRIGATRTKDAVWNMMDLIAYCDGEHDLIDIAEILGVDAGGLIPMAERLVAEGLLEARGDCDTKEGDCT
jgi:aminopeptidase-like protein